MQRFSLHGSGSQRAARKHGHQPATGAGIPERDNLLDVSGQKRGDRPALFILMDMPTVVRKQANGSVNIGHVDSLTKGNASHVGAEETGEDRCVLELGGSLGSGRRGPPPPE